MALDRQSLRVIQVGPSPHARGGVASVIANLCRAFEGDPDIAVSTVCSSRGREQPLVVRAALTVSALARVLAICLRRRKPVLHLHFTPRGATLRKGILLRLARWFGVPALLHDHTIEASYPEAGPWMQRWIRAALRRATLIVVLSEREKRFLRSLVDTPIEVIPNGIVLCDAPEQSSHVAGQPARFLFVGGQMRRKGVFVLLEAFAQLSREGVDARLTIAGDDESGAVRQWVRDHRLEAGVTLPGWVVGAEKTQLLQDSSVFVLPSFREGMPMAILEAMAYGLPVIATAVAGVPDAVENEKQGLLVTPGDAAGLAAAMKRLAFDPELRRAFGRAARQRAEERFALPVVAARFKQIYRRLASPPR